MRPVLALMTAALLEPGGLVVPDESGEVLVVTGGGTWTVPALWK